MAIALAAPPPAFVQAVEQRLATTHMHVVDWWADDLDGDHVLESIALACDTYGEYIVQRGDTLLEMPAAIDGRNPCPETAAPWHVEHTGTIAFTQSVHHGSVSQSFAIRGGKLVQLRLHSDGFEVGRDGNTDEVDDVDYEALRWSSRITPPDHKATATSGPLVIVTDAVRRTTTIIGATTIAATRDDDHGAIVLHVHADRELTIRSATAVHLARGDSELQVDASGEVDVVAGGATIHVHFQPIDGNASYPAATP
nr:hypothetical protein [Kofleriaceae bacterium]